ncbi:1-deoxy-D-xylulose-5-phosphate synthase N-terminal domain-containing protein [Siphonobacter sp. SORGH_AS_1065]|uniref:1-deoxy-D-xylulose-5-phosphate synthase N-terminal domain-containing protein n=1 Tax=Siphonobacter sp. SORGH_AS_1065 TaxID=3041795 RepID=UPI002780D9C5|nr:1-deoxy-D-xylulose-5-phosphate synthase N-terminal domain-containing protein [Siphonobacter sp. SORGH_AS_1065]MDQ1088830.1 transketolase [Siphonobacter sp. SORGH_AS_1065]
MLETELKQLAGELRLKTLGLYKMANAGHIGCSMSCLDLMIGTLVKQKRESETFILSKGHAAAALYICLNYLGEISDDTLQTFYKNHTTLPAHPAPNKHAGIPFATGSLGHGLPIATGIAKANQLLDADLLTFVLMSDGETNEGTTWEALHFAVNNQLDQLIVLIDRNRLQGFGQTQDILGDSADPRKYEAIGAEVHEIDGHDIPAIIQTVEHLRSQRNGKPKVIVANTVKGKGISYMENRMEWHYLPMSADLYEQAQKDVTETYQLSVEHV